MTDEASDEVPVAFAKGVLDDVAELTSTTAEDDQVRKVKHRHPSLPNAGGFDSTWRSG